MPAIEVNQYAWLAGMVDGDGTLTINPSDFNPRLMITQIHLPTILYLQETFGGKFHSKGLTGLSRKEYWCWCVYKSWLRGHLCHLLPFLVTKKRQVEVILQFLEASPTERQALFDELTILNGDRRRVQHACY
jgi:hypothetical protein